MEERSKLRCFYFEMAVSIRSDRLLNADKELMLKLLDAAESLLKELI